MRMLIDLFDNEHGYARIFAEKEGFGYELSTYRPLPHSRFVWPHERLFIARSRLRSRQTSARLDQAGNAAEVASGSAQV